MTRGGQDPTFHGDLELSLGLLFGSSLFALVCVALTLLATHWGKKKMDGDRRTF